MISNREDRCQGVVSGRERGENWGGGFPEERVEGGGGGWFLGEREEWGGFGVSGRERGEVWGWFPGEVWGWFLGERGEVWGGGGGFLTI